MALVEGELGEKIFSLLTDSAIPGIEGRYQEAMDMLIGAWELLPAPKENTDESYLIVASILGLALKNNDVDTLVRWGDKIMITDPERIDVGSREMWVARIAYETGDLEKAFQNMKIAVKKSRGRCFTETDNKYKRFYTNYRH